MARDREGERIKFKKMIQLELEGAPSWVRERLGDTTGVMETRRIGQKRRIHQGG